MREVITIQVGQAGNTIGDRVRKRHSVFSHEEQGRLRASFGNWPVRSMVLIHRARFVAKVIYNSNVWMFILLVHGTDVMSHVRSSSISISSRSIGFEVRPTVNSIILNWWSMASPVRVTTLPRDFSLKVIDSSDWRSSDNDAGCFQEQRSFPIRWMSCVKWPKNVISSMAFNSCTVSVEEPAVDSVRWSSIRSAKSIQIVFEPRIPSSLLYRCLKLLYAEYQRAILSLKDLCHSLRLNRTMQYWRWRVRRASFKRTIERKAVIH